MFRPNLLIWIGGVCLLGGLLVGYHAWLAFHHASVVVEWSTASELNTAGYNLNRGDQPGGPFTRVNPELIPASDDPLTGGNYSYTDQDVVPGHTYYYQLVDVEFDGNTSVHGPIEVKAQSGAPVEAILALILVGFGMFLGVSNSHAKSTA
jgi:hypothetical protein